MQKPLHSLRAEHKKRKLIIFDLDGTLAESKLPMDSEMSKLLGELLGQKHVAVIGGGKYAQFQKQFLGSLKSPTPLLKNLFLFPTTSTSFYRYRNDWRKVYSHELSSAQKKTIRHAFQKTFIETRYVHPKKRYGIILEDRKTQMTFSALGQKAPVKIKEQWNKNSDIRPQLMEALRRHLPAFEVRSGGLTSIDVTQKGIDKEYGIRQIRQELGVSFKDMLFVGDALYPGGNDAAALRTGIPCIAVKSPKDTKRIISALIASKK